MPISSFLTDNYKMDAKSGKAIYYHAVGVVSWGKHRSKNTVPTRGLCES